MSSMKGRRHPVARTPRATTEWLLANARVHEHYIDRTANDIIFAVLAEYAPEVPVELINPVNFHNPVISTRANGATLRAVLEDVCRHAFVRMEVTGKGALRFSDETVEQKLKTATIIAEELQLRRVKHPNEARGVD